MPGLIISFCKGFCVGKSLTLLVKLCCGLAMSADKLLTYPLYLLWHIVVCRCASLSAHTKLIIEILLLNV